MDDKVWEVLKTKIIGEIPADVVLTSENIIDGFLKVSHDGIQERVNLATSNASKHIEFYKEMTRKNEILEAIGKVNTNVTNTGENVKNAVIADNDRTRNLIVGINEETKEQVINAIEETRAVLAGGIGALGGMVATGFESQNVDIAGVNEAIKRLGLDIGRESRETRYTIVKEGLGNTNVILGNMRKMEDGLTTELGISTNILKDEIGREGRETRFRGYVNYLKLADQIRKSEQDLSGDIENILERQENTSYIIAKAKIALEEKIESSAEKIQEELTEHDNIMRTNTDPVYRGMKNAGFKRADVENFLKNVKKKGVDYKIRYEEEGIDFEFYTKLFVEGQRRAFNPQEIMDYVLKKDTADKTVKEATNDMSDFIYTKRNLR